MLEFLKHTIFCSYANENQRIIFTIKDIFLKGKKKRF